jgi:pimeloyl-ACP methyl ester carboxylesterase
MTCRSGVRLIVRYLVSLFAFVAMHGCTTLTPTATVTGPRNGVSTEEALKLAMTWASQAPTLHNTDAQTNAWMRCAVLAHDAMASDEASTREAAASLATSCSRWYIDAFAQGDVIDVHTGHMLLGHRIIRVEFRGLPENLGDHVWLESSDMVSVDIFGGVRNRHDGFGVPLVAFAPTCKDRPICSLYPPEGIFRPATFWMEGAADSHRKGEEPVFVLQYSVTQPGHQVGAHAYRLADDLSAPYAQLIEHSNLRRLGWWGLIGGTAVGHRAGVFLLDDYDPTKTPIIMIHGLASSPRIWARLSNAITGDPELHNRYQIWHVVYQTNAPLLIERYRIQTYLDATWKIVDPNGTAPARKGDVLIGHSMGGVIARLLCAQSIPALWNAAFTVPIDSLHGSDSDRALLRDIFQFTPYPGIDEEIFMAAPQHGSPAAGYWYGRIAQDLAWEEVPELAALRRLSKENPNAIQSDLQREFELGHLSSLKSLLPDEPVTKVDSQLLPVTGVRYHTIAGVQPGQKPPGDGFVPLSSALIPGAASTLIVQSNHQVPNKAQAIAAVLDILRHHDATP